MKNQLKFEDIAMAQAAAIEMSMNVQGTGYAAVILSRNVFYVEDEPAMIRTWETLISEFENGINLKTNE